MAKPAKQLNREIQEALASRPRSGPRSGSALSPRSFVARIWSTDGKTMLGGVMRSESSPFSHREDAESFLATSIENNANAGRAVTGEVIPSSKSAALLRHADTGDLVTSSTAAKRNAHATRRDARVASNGAGNFLDPPEYPTHHYRVETDLRRRPENRGSLSITAATEVPWLDPDTRREAKALITKWTKSRPAITSTAVQDWIHQVLGYFKNGYRNPSAGAQQWHASHLVFDDRDPINNIDDHAGVHLIRKFYPKFTPTRQDFARAYWGNR